MEEKNQIKSGLELLHSVKDRGVVQFVRHTMMVMIIQPRVALPACGGLVIGVRSYSVGGVKQMVYSTFQESLVRAQSEGWVGLPRYTTGDSSFSDTNQAPNTRAYQKLRGKGI